MPREHPRPDHGDWQQHAACRGQDPDLWHPSGDGGTARAAMRQAIAICRTCPVQLECLDLGHRVDAAHTAYNGRGVGIYGGLTGNARYWARRGRHTDGPPVNRNEPRPINHGTEGGARTHTRRGEDPCDACRLAALDARARRKRAAS